MQNRRGVDWMQQLSATKEGRDVTHVARRMTIEHRDEHLDVKVKQSLQSLDRSWRFQEPEVSAKKYSWYWFLLAAECGR